LTWKNFSIWRGRLPHWRAEDVVYYVTFRHRRPLSEPERNVLLGALLKSDGRYLDFLIVCVLPENSEIIFTARTSPSGETYELSDVVERAKTRAGRMITKHSGELYPPFYGESYDRIVRDEAELEQLWSAIFDSPVSHELAEKPEQYPWLWVATGE
jgi:hypothetical protein